MRIALVFYLRKLTIRLPAYTGKPLILASNHPNSFLDALIIGSYSKRPVHFLARGDAFAKPIVNKLLRALKMIPVYRISEGRDQLQHNQDSFEECLDVLKSNGCLLIFSEGICKNDWNLRPLKKGTARIALMAWQQQVQRLLVVPVTLSYDTFSRLPLTVYIKAGEPIDSSQINTQDEPHFYKTFNALLTERLAANMVPERAFPSKGSLTVKQWLLFVPAVIGGVTHLPLYILCRFFAQRKTKGTVFYHSVLFAMLLVAYPVVLITTSGLVVILTNNAWYWLLLLLLPATAYSYKYLRS